MPVCDCQHIAWLQHDVHPVALEAVTGVDVGSFIDLRSEDAAWNLRIFARSVCRLTPVVGARESELVGCPEPGLKFKQHRFQQFEKQ